MPEEPIFAGRLRNNEVESRPSSSARQKKRKNSTPSSTFSPFTHSIMLDSDSPGQSKRPLSRTTVQVQEREKSDESLLEEFPDIIYFATSVEKEATRSPSHDSSLQRYTPNQTSLPRNITASFKDPFDTYPVPWDEKTDKLFRFFTDSFGPFVFSYVRNPHAGDVISSHATLCMSDPVAFHAAMIITAMARDEQAGQRLPGMQAMYHRLEAIRLVNERFRQGNMEQCLSEGSIYAVVALVGTAKLWNTVDENEIETTGVDQMIIRKGGLRVIHDQCPRLELAMYGLSLLSSGLINPAVSATYHNPRELQHESYEQQTISDHLLSFLRKLGSLKTVHRGRINMIQFAFLPSLGVFELLESGNGFPYMSETKRYVVQHRLRDGILFYVCCFLLEMQTSEDLMNFVKHLQYVLRHRWVWRDSIRMLHWMLSSQIERLSLANSAVAWEALTLVGASEMLSDDSRRQVREYMLDLLTAGMVQSLDFDRLRRELQEVIAGRIRR